MKHQRLAMILLLSVLGMMVLGFQPQNTVHAAPGVTADAIDEYLRQKKSPLAGYGDTFVEYGREFGVDPRLVVAIAGAESTFGRNGMCATERHNAWGYGGGFPNCRTFNSWQRGIYVVTWQIGAGKYYFTEGNDTLEGIGSRWCASGCRSWVPNVTRFYTDLGGDTSNLHFEEATSNPVPPPQSAPPAPQPPAPVPQPPALPPATISYEVSPSNGACGSNGIIALKMFPLGEEIGVTVYKCSQEPFAKDGKLYLLADNIPIWGPIRYNQGDSHIGFTIRPGDYELTGTHQFQAYTYADGDTNPNRTGYVNLRQR